MATPISLAEWTPPFDDDVTLRAAYDAMPGDDAAAIPWYVRLVENPASPVALPGAVDLFGHDCVHILLGRGTSSHDEAFVLGATMGASGRLSETQRALYLLCARRLYRGDYRMSASDRLVFDLGAEFARGSGTRPLHTAPWRTLLDRTLGDLRSDLGVDRARLLDVYTVERALWPEHPASARLPRAAVADTRPAAGGRRDAHV